MLSVFLCVCWPSVCLLWRNTCFGLPLIFDGVVCYFDIEPHELLYILEINPLSLASFAVTFTQSEGCLFVLFMVSFSVQGLILFQLP